MEGLILTSLQPVAMEEDSLLVREMPSFACGSRATFDSQQRRRLWTGDNPPGLLKNFANVVSAPRLPGIGLQRFRPAAALSDEGPENEALANVRPISNSSQC